jgi:hypothetical protein
MRPAISLLRLCCCPRTPQGPMTYLAARTSMRISAMDSATEMGQPGATASTSVICHYQQPHICGATAFRVIGVGPNTKFAHTGALGVRHTQSSFWQRSCNGLRPVSNNVEILANVLTGPANCLTLNAFCSDLAVVIR